MEQTEIIGLYREFSANGMNGFLAVILSLVGYYIKTVSGTAKKAKAVAEQNTRNLQGMETKHNILDKRVGDLESISKQIPEINTKLDVLSQDMQLIKQVLLQQTNNSNGTVISNNNSK